MRIEHAQNLAGRCGISPDSVGQIPQPELPYVHMASIVVVEDEPLLGRQLVRSLETAGHHVRIAATAEDALGMLREDPPDLALLDLRLPDRSGLDVLAELQRDSIDVSVVLMTAYGSVRDAVQAMRLGAVDYLQKPLDLEELALTVQRVLAHEREARELRWLRSRDRGLPVGLGGKDPHLVSLFAQIERLREADLPPTKRPAILLAGETGTGKGVVARAIHEILGEGPFIEVNCTAMPSSLVEAELFGHERGSFTDARTSRTGLFEAADGGTLFLDEIGDLDLGLQAKFLKAIEEKRIRRLGSSRDRAVDVHIIAATHRDLDAAVASGTFRADLLHRLRVLAFEIPPLRERPDDIVLLARHFAAELGQLYGGRPRVLLPKAERRLLRYAWPGNVRELRNILERVMLLQPETEIDAEAFEALLAPGSVEATHPLQSISESASGTHRSASGEEDELVEAAPPATGEPAPERFRLPAGGVDLEEVERSLIVQALERTRGNRTQAAALLGLSRDTLRYRIEKYGVDA